MAQSSGGVSASTSEGVSSSGAGSKLSEGEKNASDGFWRRYRPTHLGLELGIYGGLHFFPYNHNLQSFRVVDERREHQRLRTAGELGLRLGLYPLSFLGGEVEGGLIFTQAAGTNDDAKIWYIRGHGILQLPLGRLVPFVMGGGGLYHLSAAGSLGKDSDPIVYFGGGLKFQFIQRLALRLDVRDNFFQKNKLVPGTKDGKVLQHVEITLGLSLTFGRTPWTEAPPDRDADGVLDRDDQCPADAGPAPTGCPPPPDADRDGIPDNSDPCPTEAEDGNPPDAKDGCPNKDLDGDKIEIPVDLCPDQAGIAPDGCPPKDSDGDGLMDNEDRCPRDAETVNNFEDQDGCPDTLPDQVKKAASVMKSYPTLRIRISGHTDNKGKLAKNQKLSEDRANSVKAYLVSKGVESSRVETRGVGPDEPIADNKTNAGRTQNRRIEFELLPQ
jgi:OOP family OmpA-OmpF porin